MLSCTYQFLSRPAKLGKEFYHDDAAFVARTASLTVEAGLVTRAAHASRLIVVQHLRMATEIASVLMLRTFVARVEGGNNSNTELIIIK